MPGFLCSHGASFALLLQFAPEWSKAESHGRQGLEGEIALLLSFHSIYRVLALYHSPLLLEQEQTEQKLLEATWRMGLRLALRQSNKRSKSKYRRSGRVAAEGLSRLGECQVRSQDHRAFLVAFGDDLEE